MDISEWSGENAGSRLHVQIQLAGGTPVADLRYAMRKLHGDVRWDSRSCQLHIVADRSLHDDLFLRELDDLVESFNRGRDQSKQAEILETRLVQTSPPAGSAQLFSSRFQIRSHREPGDSIDTIVLEANRSFGSGTHPSTRLVFHLLENFIGKPFPERVIDVGCGSGILSLVSARLGAREVLGMDVCPHAVDVACRNVATNHLEEKVAITDVALREINGTFDLILANLTPSVFYRLQNDIRRCITGEGTRLIVSGLQGRQADEIVSFLFPQGWKEEHRLSSGKWKALLFAFTIPSK